MKFKAVFSRSRSFVLAAALTAIAFIGAGSSSIKPQNQSAQPASEELRSSVITLIPKLEILSVVQLGETFIEVTLRNGYDKDITAVATSLGPRRSYYRDYTQAELEPYQKLAPGAFDIFYYENPLLKGEKLLITAVVFGDLTTQGDPRDVQYILDKRAGMKTQLGRIKPALQNLGKADESSVRSQLAELRRVAESLPVKNEDGSPTPSGIELGLRDGRTDILKYISEMETNLENEKIEKFYQGGQLQIIRHSGYENFQQSFKKTERYVKGLLKRL